MTHVYACLLFTCYQYQGDVFTSFLSSVTITQCPVMKVYPVSLCNILLKSHCSQHSELCSDPACSKYEVKAGAREREDTRVQNANCRPWVPAPGWCRPGNRPTQKFTMQCPEKAPTKAFFLLKSRKAPLTALCCSLSAQRRNFINEYFQH